MAQPTLTVAPQHNTDEMVGQVFVEQSFAVQVSVSNSGTADLLTLPEGALVTRVYARIVDALDGSGTFEVGVSGNADALIDGADWVETTADEVATNLASSNADYPGGMFLPDGGTLIATVGGSPTEGTVEVVIFWLELDDILSAADTEKDDLLHRTVTV